MTRQLTVQRASEIPIKARRDNWGGWTYDGSWLSYPAYGPRRNTYDIGLDRLTTQDEILNFIDHVSRKLWATDACVAGFVRALGDIAGGGRRLMVGVEA